MHVVHRTNQPTRAHKLWLIIPHPVSFNVVPCPPASSCSAAQAGEREAIIPYMYCGIYCAMSFFMDRAFMRTLDHTGRVPRTVPKCEEARSGAAARPSSDIHVVCVLARVIPSTLDAHVQLTVVRLTGTTDHDSRYALSDTIVEHTHANNMHTHANILSGMLTLTSCGRQHTAKPPRETRTGERHLRAPDGRRTLSHALFSTETVLSIVRVRQRSTSAIMLARERSCSGHKASC